MTEPLVGCAVAGQSFGMRHLGVTSGHDYGELTFLAGNPHVLLASEADMTAWRTARAV